MSYLQSTKPVFFTYAGDYIKLLLYADIVRGFSDLTFADVVDTEFYVYDSVGELKLSKLTGRVFYDGVLVYNGTQVVVNTSADFEFDSENLVAGVILNEGDTAEFLPGVYDVKLVITFENNKVFTYTYRGALQFLRSFV